MPFVRRKREEPRLDLTPMVDVVFNLLIFFMISTTFVETPGISIKLPESGARVETKAPEELKVGLDRAGQIYLRGEAVSLAEFRSRLRALSGRAGEMSFVLHADQEARHGRVVELMDAAREAGFGKLAIATEERRER